MSSEKAERQVPSCCDVMGGRDSDEAGGTASILPHPGSAVRMRLLHLLVAAATCAPSLIGAQGAGDLSRSAAAGFIPERLARIDTWVQRQVAERKIPGAVVMIVRDGEVAYHKSFGVRDLETGAPQRRDDIFRIASQTKAITST